MTNNNFIERLQQFRQTISGDPKQQLQQLLNSGKVSQAQYDQAVQQATPIAKALGIPIQ